MVLPPYSKPGEDTLPGDGLSPPQTSPLLGDSLPKKELPEEKFGYSLSELEKYRSDPFWRTLRFVFLINALALFMEKFNGIICLHQANVIVVSDLSL